jgi:hypothetical protein
MSYAQPRGRAKCHRLSLGKEPSPYGLSLGEGFNVMDST